MGTVFIRDEIVSDKSKVSKETRKKFFDFIGLEGQTIEEKSRVFVNSAKKEDSGWVFNNILKFMQFLLERANRKEITGSPIRNYVKSIKLFCEMADLTIAWKKITRG